jgi:hypothetical protein
LLSLSIGDIEAGYVTGEDLDSGALLKLDEQMQQIRDSLPPPPHNISIKYVKGAYGVFDCQFCHKRNEIAPGGYRSRSDYVPKDAPPSSGHYAPPSNGYYEIDAPGGSNPDPLSPTTAPKAEGVVAGPRTKRLPAPSVAPAKGTQEFTFAKDTRPTAGASVGGVGSLCWWTSKGNGDGNR